MRAVLGRALRQLDYQLGRAILSPLLERHFAERNRVSVESVLGNIPVIASLTTYGKRINTVHLSIESIGAGRARPERLILWVDDPIHANEPTPELSRLIRRGLEVRLTEDLRSHKKYFPTLSEFAPADGRYLVTADDDLFYPRWWLERLWDGVQAHPDEIVGHRAHSIRISGERIAPYSTWEPCWNTHAALTNFATSGSGAAFPPAMIQALRRAGLAFLEVSPTADDVWLSAVAASAGIPTRQLRWLPRVWPVIRGSQSEGLFHTNVLEGGNDKQVAAAFSPRLVAQLAADQARR